MRKKEKTNFFDAEGNNGYTLALIYFSTFDEFRVPPHYYYVYSYRYNIYLHDRRQWSNEKSKKKVKEERKSHGKEALESRVSSANKLIQKVKYITLWELMSRVVFVKIVDTSKREVERFWEKVRTEWVYTYVYCIYICIHIHYIYLFEKQARLKVTRGGRGKENQE